MKTKISTIGLAALFIGAGMLLSPYADAQGRNRASGLFGGSGTSNRWAPSLGSRSGHGQGLFGTSKAPNLQQWNNLGNFLGMFNGNRNNSGPFGGHGNNGLLGDYRNNGLWGDYGRNHKDRDPDRAYANAYRDVGIANAIVGLVGVIAQSEANARVYRPQPVAQYERQKVVLREGYYEEYKVWVPDTMNPRTREAIAGHYESHRRWVPEVYGYRDVYITPGPVIEGPPAP